MADIVDFIELTYSMQGLSVRSSAVLLCNNVKPPLVVLLFVLQVNSFEGITLCKTAIRIFGSASSIPEMHFVTALLQ